MNAASRVFQDDNAFRGSLPRFILCKDALIVLLLLVALVVSAVAVIYVKNDVRQLYTHLQQLQKDRNTSKVHYGQLLLEKSSWSTPARIQSIAQSKLGMRYPTAKNIIILDE